MALPNITLNIQNTIHGIPEDGNLLYKYQPFSNLKMLEPNGDTGLTNLTLDAKDAGVDITKPIQIDTELSYDDSVNLIINDAVNPLKIVNTRFYLTNSNSYKIGERRGNLDTNIYTTDNFKIETGLIKTVRTITSIDFLGIEDGGTMSVGSYIFYFKLADADGNESDFIGESGKVVCHIGDINKPKSIRGGILQENSRKLIKFRLNNLDLAYDYINIYYTKTSGDGESEFQSSFKINDKYKITNSDNEINITGFEEHVEIDPTEINIKYTSFDSVKTNENCQNITFAGNITNNYEIYNTLEKYSLLITPQLITDKTIGNLNNSYVESYPDNGYEYFNSKNIYYKLGLWDEDIYRFGIVYIMNNYSLSPVFNPRGIKELTETPNFKSFKVEDTINWEEDYIIEGTDENVKGVFKVNLNDYNTFNYSEQLKPIGIKFNFSENVLEGNILKGLKGLKELTKGFFIVRQKRIPTILAQGVAISTSEKSYTPAIKGFFYDSTNGQHNNWSFSESFLHKDYTASVANQKPILGRGLFKIDSIKNNALVCPEASLKISTFNSIFNSSEFLLKRFKYKSSGIFIDNEAKKSIFNLGDLSPSLDRSEIKSNLLLIEPGIELISNENVKFSSKMGDASDGFLHTDANFGSIEDPNNSTNSSGDLLTNSDWTDSVSKLRGEFNTYIGSTKELSHGQYYNIMQKDYVSSRWKDYFKIRYNDSSPFMAASDRYSWDNIDNKSTESIYRGDCYICTYSHRMNWNFIDPQSPTNRQIIDPYTWFKNFKVEVTNIKIENINIGTTANPKFEEVVVEDDSNSYVKDDTNTSEVSNVLSYRKILELFTYKFTGDITTNDSSSFLETIGFNKFKGVVTPKGRKYKKYAEISGEFGSTKMNRADINAVGLGHWITFKICSNINLSMRDLDFSNPQEETIHKQKRGFYPFQDASPNNKLPESNVINSGISKSLGDKYYFAIPEVPFIKTSFTNRIYHSNLLLESSFKNGNRVFKSNNYQDYTNEYGALIKLVEWYGTLVAVMEHGVIMIPVNERAMAANASGENVYINTDNVLPKNPKIISNTFGSLWDGSIIKTSRYIYGVDTVGKKIWRTNGETFDTISDLKIQKFLNDNMSLKTSDQDNFVGVKYVKTMYNAFKQDIIFTMVYGKNEWVLCWNELSEKWITRYSWFPEFSENINNIFYTFASKNKYLENFNVLYKHGFAGNEEEVMEIKPTYWYDKQEPFEFEFVVVGTQGIQKIFNNLKIISNLAEPESFYYEIVGEGYEWNLYKEVIMWIKSKVSNINDMNNLYLYLLQNDLGAIRFIYNNFPSFSNELDSYRFKKLPYIPEMLKDNFVYDRSSNIYKDFNIYKDNRTKKNLIQIYQKGANIKKEGRLKGTMQYAEDAWDVQIEPISFKYAYLKNNQLSFSNNVESRIRDKYMKVRVRYNGEKYAIITALNTFFTLSYT